MNPNSKYESMLLQPEEEHIQMTPPSKVRVTFYESQKPHYLTPPDTYEFPFNLQKLSTMATQEVQQNKSMNEGVYNTLQSQMKKEISYEVGLVRKVQTGQPLTSSTPIEESIKKTSCTEVSAGLRNNTNSHQNMTQLSTVVDIQHGIVVPPASPTNVEKVTIKKKPKCQCCVIM